VVLEKDGECNLDRSWEKWRGPIELRRRRITYIQ